MVSIFVVSLIVVTIVIGVSCGQQQVDITLHEANVVSVVLGVVLLLLVVVYVFVIVVLLVVNHILCSSGQ